MKQQTFKGHVLLLAESTNKDLSASLAALWFDKFGALPDDILLAAFGQALDTCKFFPSVAEFNDVLTLVRRAAGDPDVTRPEDEAATLMKKIGRYNPDLGIVNDGTRGLIIAHRSNRGEDWEGSGFTARERRVLRLFGGAARVCAWDDKDRQFNYPRMVKAFADSQVDDAAAARLQATYESPPLPPPAPLRRIDGAS